MFSGPKPMQFVPAVPMLAMAVHLYPKVPRGSRYSDKEEVLH